MTTWLRRLFWLGLLAGVGCAVATALKRRNEPPSDLTQTGGTTTATGAPSASPRPAFTEIEADEASAIDDSTGSQRWRDPVDGACPPSHPIKANAKSEIYHVPGGRFYDRTIPERCYATAEDAEADGYRRSKA